jgi:hypothetical protein
MLPWFMAVAFHGSTRQAAKKLSVKNLNCWRIGISVLTYTL